MLPSRNPSSCLKPIDLKTDITTTLLSTRPEKSGSTDYMSWMIKSLALAGPVLVDRNQNDDDTISTMSSLFTYSSQTNNTSTLAQGALLSCVHITQATGLAA